MKRNFMPFAALMFLCAVFLIVAGAILFFPALPLSDLPVPTFLPVFHFN